MDISIINSERWRSLDDLQGEVWKESPLVQTDGSIYASNFGRVKICVKYVLNMRAGIIEKYGNKNAILRQFIDGREYYKVMINKKPVSVARLVCSAFKENPEGKRCVDHINGDRHDNREENLRWVSHRENSRNPNTRFIQRGTKRIEQYYQGKLIATYGSIRYAAEETGIPRATLGKRLAAEGGKILLGGFVFSVAENPANSHANLKEETRHRSACNGFPKPLNKFEP